MSGHPRTHQNAILRTYAGLLLISICVYTLMYAPQPMFNSVSRDFGVDKGSTGLLVSVFMLSLAVSPLCVGMLLSRIGVRRAILGASLLLGISGVGIWFAPSAFTVFWGSCGAVDMPGDLGFPPQWDRLFAGTGLLSCGRGEKR